MKTITEVTFPQPLTGFALRGPVVVRVARGADAAAVVDWVHHSVLTRFESEPGELSFETVEPDAQPRFPPVLRMPAPIVTPAMVRRIQRACAGI